MDAADWWRELSFECRQPTTVREHRFVSCYSLEVFVLPQSEPDVDYEREPDDWTSYEAARVLAVPTSMVDAYLTGFVMAGTMHE